MNADGLPLRPAGPALPVHLLADPAAAATVDATDAEGLPATAVEYRWDPTATCELLADALARLHALSPALEPSPEPSPGPGADDGAGPQVVLRPDDVVAMVRSRTGGAEGLDAAYAHLSRERLVEILAEGAARLDPESQLHPAVLTHGRPTLDNLLCSEGRAVGFLDWSAAAVADPHRDLAVAATAVASSLGPMLVPVFFDRYGTRPDPVRLDWWALAAQLLR